MARALKAVAAVSGAYDVALGLALLGARPVLMRLFDLPAPVPPIHADLNGLFALAIGVGYWWPYHDPERYRGYLWVMGPALKGIGAAWFVADHFWRGSPASFLAFAAGDGVIAAVTACVLLASRRPTSA